MTSTAELLDADVRAPSKWGSENSNVIQQAVSTSAVAVALPATWEGSYINLKVTGCNAYWFISDQSATLPLAAATGTGQQVGFPLLNGEERSYRVPKPPQPPEKTIYLCVVGDGSGSLYVHKSSA